MSCQASIDASCLSFVAPAALRLQLHNAAMLPQPRLAFTTNYYAILRHFMHDMTLVFFDWLVAVDQEFVSVVFG